MGADHARHRYARRIGWLRSGVSRRGDPFGIESEKLKGKSKNDK